MTNDNHQEGRESEIKRFVSKELLVEAVRLTFENQQEVKEWSGGKTWSRPPMRAVTGITLAVNFNVPFGHYIFRDEEGAFHYLSAEVFEKTYEPAPPEQAKQQEGEAAKIIKSLVDIYKKYANDDPAEDHIIDWANDYLSRPASEGKPVDEGSKTDFQIAWELSGTKDKPFFIDTFRKLLKLYDAEEISLSKMVEELNISAYKWAGYKYRSEGQGQEDQEALWLEFSNFQDGNLTHTQFIEHGKMAFTISRKEKGEAK